MATVGEVISRIRGQVKAEVQDAFVTDRYVYSLIIKFAQLFLEVATKSKPASPSFALKGIIALSLNFLIFNIIYLRYDNHFHTFF